MKAKVFYLKRIFMCCLMFCFTNMVIAQDFLIKHEVKRGETLASIAKQYGVTEQMIKDANPQMGNLFYVGLKLDIPKQSDLIVNEQKNEDIETDSEVQIEEIQTQILDSDEDSKESEYLNDNDNIAELEDDVAGGIGIGYWSYDGGETYGLQITSLGYNSWAGEFNLRYSFGDVKLCNVDFAFLGYSFGLTDNEDYAIYLALVAGPSLGYRYVYDVESQKEKEKYYLDGYAAASVHMQISRKFYIKGGYQIWAPQFKFGKDYRAEGFYVAIGFDV